MADIVSLKKALEYTVENFDNENDYVARDKAAKFAKDHDLNEADLKAYRASIYLPVPNANPIKAHVIDKVASNPKYSFDQYSPIGLGERFLIKNFIDEDPDLQVKYLEKKGYKARVNNGEVEAAKPGEFFQRIDPSDLEISDVIDVVGDGIQAGIEGAITAAGVAGVPATSGWSLPATAGLGALAAGGMEKVKQELARTFGLRDDTNYARVAEKAGIGGIFPLIPGVIGRIPENAANKWKNMPKPNTQEITEAARRLGVEPTPGMLSANPDIQALESARASAPRTLFNAKLKDTIDFNKATTDDFANDLLGNRLDIRQTEASQVIQPTIVKSLEEKLAKSQELYDKIGKTLNRRQYLVNPESMNANLAASYSDFKFDPIGKLWVENRMRDIDNIKTVDDLRKFNRALRSDADRYKMSDPTLSRLASNTAHESKALIDETFAQILDDWQSKLESNSTKYTPEQIDKTIAYIQGLRNDLKEANALYRDVNIQADAILKRPGESTKGSANTKIEKIATQDFTKTFNAVYSAGDLKKAQWMADNYPNETALARGTILQEIFTRASNVRKGNGKQSFGSAVSQQLRTMPDAKKTILFGYEGKKKAEDMATYFGNLPADVNPSGTGKNAAFFDPKIIGDFISGGINAFRSKMAEWGAMRWGVKAFGYAVDSPITRGAAYQTGKQSLLPFTENQSTNDVQSLIPRR